MIKLTGTVLEVYKSLVRQFLAMVDVIKRLNPAYKQPGDGSNGTCDCIGLIIGALKRMGIKWDGIHGSNYAARYQTVDLEPIHGQASLDLGDIVYKAHNQGAAKYDLPSRYKPGNKYYNGDLKDYYHAGTVTQVNPLRITHMTSPHIKVDSSIGNWNYHGKVKPLVEKAEKEGGITPEPIPVPEPVPSKGSTAIVEADNGLPVKMREYPSESCRTWIKVLCGTELTIVEPGEKWAKVNGCGKKGWYMMAKFLDVVGDSKGKY